MSVIFLVFFSLPPVPAPEEKTSEQKAAEIQKEHDMETRKKSEFTKKETEVLEEIQSMQVCFLDHFIMIIGVMQAQKICGTWEPGSRETQASEEFLKFFCPFVFPHTKKAT